MLLQKIEVLKQITASMLAKNSTHTIGKDILTVVKQHHQRQCGKRRDRDAKGRATHQNRILAADSIYRKKRDRLETWSATDLKKILMPLKRKGHAAIPTKKPQLLVLFLKWKLENCQRVHFVSALLGVNKVEDIDEDSDVDGDDEDGMNIEVV